MGDNREDSKDSRHLGPISKDTTYTATYEENAVDPEDPVDPADLLNEALNSEGE